MNTGNEWVCYESQTVFRCTIFLTFCFTLTGLFTATSFRILVLIYRHVVRTEGVSALFKGLGPTLIGIAPSR